jgi:hypothetical protein
MITFQVKADEDGGSSRGSAMTTAVMETVIPAIKAKAQELFIECNTNVNVVLEATPYTDS